MNRKLTAMNKLLMEENERLQKQVSQLVHENAYMRQQLQSVRLKINTLTYKFIHSVWVSFSERILFYNVGINSERYEL